MQAGSLRFPEFLQAGVRPATVPAPGLPGALLLVLSCLFCSPEYSCCLFCLLLEEFPATLPTPSYPLRDLKRPWESQGRLWDDLGWDSLGIWTYMWRSWNHSASYLPGLLAVLYIIFGEQFRSSDDGSWKVEAQGQFLLGGKVKVTKEIWLFCHMMKFSFCWSRRFPRWRTSNCLLLQNLP